MLVLCPGQQKPCHLFSLDLTCLQPSGDTAYLVLYRGAFYTRYFWLGPDSGTRLLLSGGGVCGLASAEEHASLTSGHSPCMVDGFWFGRGPPHCKKHLSPPGHFKGTGGLTV